MGSAKFKKRRAKPIKEAGKAARTKPSIFAQPYFMPILVVWGGLLLGLVLLILPDNAILHIANLAKIGTMGGMVRYALALLAAMVGCVAGYFLAVSLRPKNADAANNKAAASERRAGPIDPAADLGSESLDAPLEIAPEEFDEASVPHSLLEETPRSEQHEVPKSPGARGIFKQDEPVDVIAPLPVNPQADPLDLSEFDVEELESETRTNASFEAPTDNALEKLRRRSPRELSLAEMVERFAGALGEHRRAQDAVTLQQLRNRDKQLAKALKSLNLTGEDKNGVEAKASEETVDAEIEQTQRELRTALSKLQTLRGAA